MDIREEIKEALTHPLQFVSYQDYINAVPKTQVTLHTDEDFVRSTEIVRELLTGNDDFLDMALKHEPQHIGDHYGLSFFKIDGYDKTYTLYQRLNMVPLTLDMYVVSLLKPDVPSPEDIQAFIRVAQRMWIDATSKIVWEDSLGQQHTVYYGDTPRLVRFLRQSGWQGGASSVMARQYYWNPAKLQTGFANISRPQNPIEADVNPMEV